MSTFFLIVYIVGAAQGIFLSIALLTYRKGNFKANRYLGFCMCVLSLSLFLHITEFIPELDLPLHHVLGSVNSLLYGPLLLAYVLAITSRDWSFKPLYLLNGLPFVSFLGLFCYFVLFDAPANVFEVIKIMLQTVSTLQILIYFLLIILRLIRYARKIKESHSSLEKINLNWLLILMTGFVILWLTAAVIAVLQISSADGFWLAVTIFFLITGYIALGQPEIITQISFEEPALTGKTNKAAYSKSSLTDESANRYYDQLVTYVEKEKPYIQSTLTLPGLAKKLSISPHHLSQVINQRGKTSFFDFINAYRIKEAARLLKDKSRKNIKIAEIGYEVGYNSLSSFNKAFKKYTGLTPSSYRINAGSE